jgi:hypothetical protein
VEDCVPWQRAQGNPRCGGATGELRWKEGDRHRCLRWRAERMRVLLNALLAKIGQALRRGTPGPGSSATSRGFEGLFEGVGDVVEDKN